MSEPLRFFITWTLVGATYLAMLAAYRLGMSSSLETLRSLLAPFTLLNAVAIALTVTIPLHLLRNELVPMRTRQNEPFDDDEGTEEGTEREAVESPLLCEQVRTYDVWLWLIFILLITAGPFVLLFQMQLRVPPFPHMSAGAAATKETPLTLAPLRTSASPLATSSPDISLLPLYGGVEKPPALVVRDAAFVADIIERAGGREQALTTTFRAGWSALDAGDTDTAMKRFNQAWLIDPSSPEVYRGMARVEAWRGYSASAVALYRQALALDSERVDIACELGAAYRAGVERGSMGGASLTDAEAVFARAAAAAHGDLSAACFADRAAVARMRGLHGDAHEYETLAAAARSTTTGVMP